MVFLVTVLVFVYSSCLHAQTISAALSGLSGCSTDSFSVSSFTESLANVTPISGEGASSAGSTQALTLTKPFETCSTPILQALAEGRASGSLTLTVSAANWTSPFVIQIPKAVVNGYTLADESPSAPTENLQISYSNVSFQGPVVASGAPAAPVQVTLTGCSTFGAQGWSLGVQQAAESSSGGTSAKATYSNVSLTKSVDSCSGFLIVAANAGKALGTVTVTTPASQTSPSVKITLQNAVVSSDQIAIQTNGDPVETVSFAFKSVAVAYEGGSLP